MTMRQPRSLAMSHAPTTKIAGRPHGSWGTVARRPCLRTIPTPSGSAAKDYENASRAARSDCSRFRAGSNGPGRRSWCSLGTRRSRQDGTIKRFGTSQPRGARVVALESPRTWNANNGTFSATSPAPPTAGEMVFFRSLWYSRAGVERVMGFCTAQEYLNSCARRRNSNACWSIPAFACSSSGSPSAARTTAAFHLGRDEVAPSTGSCRRSTSSHSTCGMNIPRRKAMFFHTDTARRAWVVIIGRRQRSAPQLHAPASCPCSTIRTRTEGRSPARRIRFSWVRR